MGGGGGGDERHCEFVNSSLELVQVRAQIVTGMFRAVPT